MSDLTPGHEEVCRVMKAGGVPSRRRPRSAWVGDLAIPLALESRHREAGVCRLEGVRGLFAPAKSGG